MKWKAAQKRARSRPTARTSVHVHDRLYKCMLQSYNIETTVVKNRKQNLESTIRSLYF